jgi:hypothetical protein
VASVALCVVAGGDSYVRYAERLFESAREHFHPSDDVRLHLIAGAEGWPNGTMLRAAHLLANWPTTDFVFLCDADMRFEGPVGAEILPDGDGIVTTLHPGYLDQPPEALPFETRDDSACYVAPELRARYFCGGFWGGAQSAARRLAVSVSTRIAADAARGITPVWHDESALNSAVVHWRGPHLVLDPSYCHPDRDGFYVEHVWRRQLPRLLVALDKSSDERGDR